MTRFELSGPRLAFVALAAALLASEASAAIEAEIEREAETAADRAVLASPVAKLEARAASLTGSASPTQLEAAADAFGALVRRSRELGVDPAGFERLLRLGERLRGAVDEVRLAREERAGEDEAALEELFRSRDWRRLDYAEVVLGYWRGWALVTRGQGLPPGEVRRQAMKDAEREFARSSLDLAVPRIATTSLLGLGIARRELGDHDRARRTLEQFEKQAESQGHADLLAPARFELAILALGEGEFDRAAQLTARMPPGTLGPDQELGLLAMEAQVRLARASAGDEDARRAAALLSRLSEAGGEHARTAVGLVLEHREALAGLEVGPAGDLIAGEVAFDARRFAEARDALGRALARLGDLPGVDLDVLRYKYAASVAETGGDRLRAIDQLETLLADRGGGGVRRPAAQLYYALAEAELEAGSTRQTRTRAVRAAELLVEVDPLGPAGDHARYRLATRGEGAGGTASQRSLLGIIGVSSDAYPAARLELVRLQAGELQAAENAGRRPDAEQARGLLEDLDRVDALVREGRLAPDPERDGPLAVLRAKAAAWGGQPSARVLELANRAAALPGLDRESHRSLLRLRLRMLAREGRFEDMLNELSANQSGVRRNWDIWYEAVRAIEAQRTPSPSLETLARMQTLLAAAAPAQHRDDMALAEAQTLLRAGRAGEAAHKARALIERDPTWGNAWVTYARALDATDDAGAATEAWRQVAAGVESGTELWLEAQLGLAKAARRSGDVAGACRTVEQVRSTDPGLGGAGFRARFEAVSRGCGQPSAPPNGS